MPDAVLMQKLSAQMQGDLETVLSPASLFPVDVSGNHDI